MNFNSHTDAVLAVAVALVNALTPGCAHGRPYQPPGGDQRAGAARDALNADGATRERPVSVAEADELAGVAAELRQIFEFVADDDADRAATGVNRLLARTGAHPYLEKHDQEPWHLHFHGTDDALATGWAAGCAAGLAVVLGGPEWGRWACARPRGATGSTWTPPATAPAGSAPRPARTGSKRPPSGNEKCRPPVTDTGRKIPCLPPDLAVNLNRPSC